MTRRRSIAGRSEAPRRTARIPLADTLPPVGGATSLPVVALVGRPNTGKSTLFNRLTGSRRAVVASMPGVTRDRNIAVGVHEGRRLLIVDTGGFEADEHEELNRAVQAQSIVATEEADAIIVVLDGRAGLNPLDRALVERVRRAQKPLFVVVNKIDTPTLEDLQSDFYALGVDVLYPISAEHGLRVDTLMDAVVHALPERTDDKPASGEAPTAVAIIGRPNVGKSSLLNRLVGCQRAIVSATPGTTRDPIDMVVEHAGRTYLLVDTAGVRRRPRVQAHVERASVVRALRALERAEVGLLLIDAVEGMTEQDARIAGYAWERGRALVLVVNKWDAVGADARAAKAFARGVEERYPSFGVVPKLFVSALTGQGVARIWGSLDRAVASHRLQMQTAKVNQVVTRAVQQQAPPMVKGKRPRLFYATQTATAPPTVTIFGANPGAVHPSYERYLVNQLRAAFPLEGTPLLIRFRPRREERKQPERP